MEDFDTELGQEVRNRPTGCKRFRDPHINSHEEYLPSQAKRRRRNDDLTDKLYAVPPRSEMGPAQSVNNEEEAGPSGLRESFHPSEVSEEGVFAENELFGTEGQKRNKASEAVGRIGVKRRSSSLPHVADLETRAPPKKKMRVLAKFLSGSVSKLHLSVSNSPLVLYRKASSSLSSLTKLFDSSRSNSSLKKKQNRSSARSLNFGSSSSIAKCSWPIPWLDAIFLPEFPMKASISEEDFAILNCVGNGSFGDVYRVCLKCRPDILYAMKIQQKSEILSRNATEQVKNEASINKSLSRSVFVAKCFTTWQSRTQLYTILQYSMGYGDLYTLWQDYGPFSASTVRVYAAEIALALGHIHENNVIYRDLKLENIMLNWDGHIQIIDFGFAKRLIGDQRTNTICGTLQYMAPEVAHEEYYGKFTDWWCYGVLLHILATGNYPFPNSQAVSHKDLRYRHYYSAQVESALDSLLRQLLCLNLDERLCSLDQLKEHEFFECINWDDVASQKLVPFADIDGLQRCASCNSAYDKTGSDLDEEENWTAFDENYEFDNLDYFGESNLV